MTNSTQASTLMGTRLVATVGWMALFKFDMGVATLVSAIHRLQNPFDVRHKILVDPCHSASAMHYPCSLYVNFSTRPHIYTLNCNGLSGVLWRQLCAGELDRQSDRLIKESFNGI